MEMWLACLLWLQQKDTSKYRLLCLQLWLTPRCSVPFWPLDVRGKYSFLEWLIKIKVLNFGNWIRWLKRGSSTLKFTTIWGLWGVYKHAVGYVRPSVANMIFPLAYNALHFFPRSKSMPKSRGASNPVYLHKQSPTQLLWQELLNLSCFVSTWFLLSLWLFACLRTIGAGEWQQIVGMHLNETNYYMLTAFTMADLKELGSFNLALQDSL